MKQRVLGRTGIGVAEIGLGCWQFGGDFGPMSEAVAMSILGAAVESGINFFDTADVYGAGRSEALIGRFLKTASQPLTVATKFGRGADVFPDGYTRERLRRSVHAAQKRLGVAAIDLLQLHCIPMAVLQDGAIFNWLRDLQQEGLIRHFGASVETVEEGQVCLAQEGLASLQVIFNIFRQKPAVDLLPQAATRGVGVIVRLPLASGLLSGKFNAQTRFADSDHRHYNRDGERFNVGETFAGIPFPKGVELVDALKVHLPDTLSMAELSLRWILDHEAVSVIIPGASSPGQARGNAAVSALAALPPDLHALLRDFYTDKVHSHIRGPY